MRHLLVVVLGLALSPLLVNAQEMVPREPVKPFTPMMTEGFVPGSNQNMDGVRDIVRGMGFGGEERPLMKEPEIRRDFVDNGREMRKPPEMRDGFMSREREFGAENRAPMKSQEIRRDIMEDGRNIQKPENVKEQNMGREVYRDDKEQFSEDDRGQEMSSPEMDIKMVRQSVRGIEQGLSMIKMQMGKMTKQKIEVPADIKTVVETLESKIALIKNASEVTEEVETALMDLRDNGDSLRDIGPKLGFLTEWPRMEKSAQKEIARIKKQLSLGKASATRAKIDVASSATRIENELGEVEKALVEARALGLGDDAEGAMEMMGDGIFEPLRDISDQVSLLRMLTDIKRSLTQKEKMVEGYERQITTFSKQKKDVTELKEVVAQMKTILGDIEELVVSENPDRNLFFEMMSDFEKLGNDADDIMAKMKGRKTMLEQEMTGEKNGAATYLADLISPWLPW